MRPVSMATVQANCRACRSDLDEFKAHTATAASHSHSLDRCRLNSVITRFIVAQIMQLQIIEVLR